MWVTKTLQSSAPAPSLCQILEPIVSLSVLSFIQTSSEWSSGWVFLPVGGTDACFQNKTTSCGSQTRPLQIVCAYINSIERCAGNNTSINIEPSSVTGQPVSHSHMILLLYPC